MENYVLVTSLCIDCWNCIIIGQALKKVKLSNKVMMIGFRIISKVTKLTVSIPGSKEVRMIRELNKE